MLKRQVEIIFSSGHKVIVSFIGTIQDRYIICKNGNHKLMIFYGFMRYLTFVLNNPLRGLKSTVANECGDTGCLGYFNFGILQPKG